jgi:glycerol-3-phosphate dehydrogenase
VVWKNNGLVTVTGGKLTTFRLLARDALKEAGEYLPKQTLPPDREPVFAAPRQRQGLPASIAPDTRRRLYGRYGQQADPILDYCLENNAETIPETNILWGEVAHAAKNEQVRRLTDLLLRRVRLGLVAKDGGSMYLEKIDSLCRSSLGWDETRWEAEKAHYLETWRKFYGPPVG